MGRGKRENMGGGKERRREEKKQDRLENKNIFTHLSLDKDKDYKPFYQ